MASDEYDAYMDAELDAIEREAHDGLGIGRDAYEVDDPKHPDFAGMWLDWADQERKRLKEEGPRF